MESPSQTVVSMFHIGAFKYTHTYIHTHTHTHRYTPISGQMKFLLASVRLQSITFSTRGFIELTALIK